MVELYAFGYDAEAQVLLQDIGEDEELGRQLLEIAGRRLNLYAAGSRNAFLRIASVGHQLLSYLDSLVSDRQTVYLYTLSLTFVIHAEGDRNGAEHFYSSHQAGGDKCDRFGQAANACLQETWQARVKAPCGSRSDVQRGAHAAILKRCGCGYGTA